LTVTIYFGLLRDLGVGDAVDQVAEHISTMTCKETLVRPDHFIPWRADTVPESPEDDRV
jgi:hypothetical protein